MNKLNNKGYMLIEIILAFVIAMVLAYFIADITIKLKNKNDDLLVRILSSTDQAIIYNTIMEEIYRENFSCDNVELTGKKFTYHYIDGTNFSTIINEYAKLGEYTCAQNGDDIVFKLLMDVPELPGERFDVCYGVEC